MLNLSVVVLATVPVTGLALPNAQDSVRPRIPTLVLTGENTDRDWRFTSTFLRNELEQSGKFRVEITLFPDGALLDPGYLDRFELLVVDYDGQRWGEPSEDAFLSAVRAGKGVVVLGKSWRSFAEWEAGEALLGLEPEDAVAFDVSASLDLTLLETEHPIVAGLPPIRGLWDMAPAPRPRRPDSALVPLAAVDGEPALLAGPSGDGRVVHLRLGNVVPGDQGSQRAVADPQFQELFLRSAEWAATGAVTPNSRILPNTLTAADRAAGWQLLFDGSTTSGWRKLGSGLPEERWQVENGVLHVLPGGEPGSEDGGEIVFEQIFERFELELEWKVAEGGDPGVLYCLDHNGGPELGMDADDVDESLRILRPPGEFNHARIVATEAHVEHWLNGIHLSTLDMSSGEWAEMLRGRNLRANLERRPDLARLPLARISLRGAGTDVWLRNVKIRRLPEPTPPAATQDASVWLFDGEALNDWVWIPRQQRSTMPFSVRDGALVSAGSPDAYLRTAQAWRDYEIELEYRFTDPSGGGSAVARMTDKSGLLFHLAAGDALAREGRVWPRSIEVELASSHAGDLCNWGGIPMTIPYGSNVAADVVQRTHDNDLAPGEWNSLEVLHAGGTFRVRINGDVVNAVTDVEQAEGYFAIKAEGAAMEFRNIKLTPVGGQ